MKKLDNCPYCNGEFEILKVKCLDCGTEVSGSFQGNRFNVFGEDELFFIETFLKTAGNIRLVEKELGISYPTVKNRLAKIIEKLGYTPEPDSTSKMDILEKLSSGEISVEDALKNLEK